MTVHSWEQYRYTMAQRDRGRPSNTSDHVRLNNYHDPETGTYALSSGLKDWHTRVVDYMVLNPHAKIVDIAREFGVTPVWIGKLLKTDAFREYYTQRMDEHQDLIGKAIVHKMAAVATASLDKMNEHLAKPDVSFGAVKDAAELTLRSLGYTQPNTSRVDVNMHEIREVRVSVHREAVAKARAKLAAKMEENTKSLEDHTLEDYKQVTSSLDVRPGEVEDAEVLEPDS